MTTQTRQFDEAATAIVECLDNINSTLHGLDAMDVEDITRQLGRIANALERIASAVEQLARD